MIKITKKDAEEALRNGAKKIKESDLRRVLEKRDEIENKFENNGPLGRFIEDLKLMFAIMGDYVTGEYREIPWYTIAAIAAALLYVLSPIDLIPDFIPVIGLTDDAAVVGACLLLVEKDLHTYRNWKESRQ